MLFTDLGPCRSMYVAQKRAIRVAGKYMSRAVPFYLANSLASALIILLWGKPFFEIKLAYALLCLISLILVLVTRKMLDDYAFDSFKTWSLVTGALGIPAALVAGGVLVLVARSKLMEELGE